MQQHALVLTCRPGTAGTTDALAEAAIRLAAEQGLNAASAERWLKPGEAWECSIVGAPTATNALGARCAALRQHFADHRIDVNLVPDGPARRKRLLIADMDSTIIQQECIDEIAAEAGVGARVAGITERAMRGELDFEAALNERVALLEGLDARVLTSVFEQRIALTPGASTLVATMTAHGAHCALVSGGFTFFTSRVAAKVGFHENRANTLDIAAGRLTGKVVPPILGRAAKLEALEELRHRHGLETADCLAVGDGANDLAMITAAGLGVAFRAKPIVAAQADADITHGDLTALLYLQGFKADEFANA